MEIGFYPVFPLQQLRLPPSSYGKFEFSLEVIWKECGQNELPATADLEMACMLKPVDPPASTHWVAPGLCAAGRNTATNCAFGRDDRPGE